MNRCKCKKPKIKIIANCEVCSKCGKIIYKVRKVFYRRTKVKKSKKIYNRNKAKRKDKEE